MKRAPSIAREVLDGTTTTFTAYFDLSKVTAIQIVANYAIDEDATATLDASIAFTTSNHPDAPVGKPKNGVPVKWSTESTPTFTAITTGAQDEIVHIGNIGARWGRLVISRNSGTGQVAVLVHGRD